MADENVNAMQDEEEEADASGAIEDVSAALETLRSMLKDVTGRHTRDDPRYATLDARWFLTNEIMPLFETAADAMDQLHDAALATVEDLDRLKTSLGAAAQVGVLVQKVQALCVALRAGGCSLSPQAAVLLAELEALLSGSAP